MVIIFVFPDGSVGLASTQREAIRRFKSFEKGEEIVDFDALSLGTSASASAPDDSSDNS